MHVRKLVPAIDGLETGRRRADWLYHVQISQPGCLSLIIINMSSYRRLAFYNDRPTTSMLISIVPLHLTDALTNYRWNLVMATNLQLSR